MGEPEPVAALSPLSSISPQGEQGGDVGAGAPAPTTRTLAWGDTSPGRPNPESTTSPQPSIRGADAPDNLVQLAILDEDTIVRRARGGKGRTRARKGGTRARRMQGVWCVWVGRGVETRRCAVPWKRRLGQVRSARGSREGLKGEPGTWRPGKKAECIYLHDACVIAWPQSADFPLM